MSFTTTASLQYTPIRTQDLVRSQSLKPAANLRSCGSRSSHVVIRCSQRASTTRAESALDAPTERAGRPFDPRALGAGLSLAAVLFAAPLAPPDAWAVPQTSECATNSCDYNDYSNRDLRKELFTKGSLRNTNFENSVLNQVSLFGADLSGANLKGADLTYADLGQSNLTGADLTDAVLEGAIVSSARLEKTTVTNSDWTDVIIRKDINDMLCETASGVNPKTGVDTRESLFCP